MASTMYLKEATRLKIPTGSALSTSKRAGYIEAVGSFCGVLAEDVRGTGDAYNTGAVKGWNLSDGVGDGLGDIVLQGVYAVILASGVSVATAGTVLYGDVADNRANGDTGNPLLGWAWPVDEAGNMTRVPTADDPSWMQADQLAGGESIVHVMLAGFPKTGLV